ncbi:hypothetical protein RhiTH_005743 [Rhizoctonia solani]
MTNDTGSPLALIAAVLERHQSILQPTLSTSFAEQSSPAFDPQALRTGCQLPPSHGDIIQRVSSWGLPQDVSSQVTALLTEESSQCQALVQRVRAEILGRLIKTSIAPDPSVIPSLIESTCNAVYKSAFEKMVSEAQRQIEAFSLDNEDDESDDGIEDDYGAEHGDDDDGEIIDEQEGEEDNSPIKPGEEVPPLETKYLPIFEALHERGKVLTKPEKTYLVNMTGMTYRQITIWFQNRRRGELKESTNMVASYSKASSTHSDESSDFSEQELEKTLGSHPPNTTFDIRSWRIQSALATKDDSRGSIIPSSPFKHNFSTTADPSDTQSDSDLSDDSDDDISMPPGLQASSIAIDPNINNSASVNTTKIATSQPLATIGDIPFGPKENAHPRPIRGLPSSRRGSPSAISQQTRAQYSQSSNIQPPSQYEFHQSNETKQFSTQSVSSNERGLTVNIDSTAHLQGSTLRSSLVSMPLVAANTLISGPPSVSPSPPSTSSESPQRQVSPTSSTSPRPYIKPLPRRTGCAPRPRPPPRLGPSAPTPSPINAPSSSRPSVILPPSSNPSLGNTTLGALLRPNPPTPVIPQEIEERLNAMAGRMGVGATTFGVGIAQSISSGTLRIGEAPENGMLSNRSVPSSFGFISLPNTGTSSGAYSVTKQTARSSGSLPPTR